MSSLVKEKWSKKYKRSIDCSNPKGFSQKAHCAGRRKRKSGGKTKSRPVESLQEKMMGTLKTFVLEEINKNIKKEIAKKKLKKYGKDLYESVNLQSELKKSGANPKKLYTASKLVKLAEQKVLEGYDELNDDCGCDEGEGYMLKSQLSSIIHNAQKLHDMIDEDDQFEDWIQSKITLAEDYITTAFTYLMHSDDEEDGEYYEYEPLGEISEGSKSPKKDSPTADYKDALNPEMDDDELFEKNEKKEIEEADKKWIQTAIKKPGQLHKDLGIPKGEKIPIEKLKVAAKKTGKVGQRARMALNLRKINK